MPHSKKEWLDEFRNDIKPIEEQLENSEETLNEKTKEINAKVKSFRKSKLDDIKGKARTENWDNDRLVNEIMLMTYVSYIVMLESRNKIWPYDYMAFSRRIGELWEQFCKLAFEYPIKELEPIEPPDFKQVQDNLKRDAVEYIDSLTVSQEIKDELKKYYAIPWTMVDSGGIKLELDLHFEQNGKRYNCDFKSGFSSNEKGNTNRLLLVASIYKAIGENENNVIFVRQSEEENNHYLLTLENSPYWTVYCADACYKAIKDFTGFDIRSWMNSNIDWVNDISDDFKKHLQDNDLMKYLKW